MNAKFHSRQKKEGRHTRFETYRIKDVAPIFNLIIEMSREGVITPLYLHPTYMAGLGLQLFSILFLGRFYIHGHGWFRSAVLPIYLDEHMIGFLMTRLSVLSNQDEIYLFAIDPDFRGGGHGEAALRAFVAQRPITSSISADCLPATKGMLRLLAKVGFRRINLPKEPSVPNLYIPMIYP